MQNCFEVTLSELGNTIMKWLSFSVQGRECFGFLTGDNMVVDYAAAAAAIGKGVHPRTLLEFVEAGDVEQTTANDIAARFADGGLKAICYPVKDIAFRAPIRRPSKILGVPINNSSINKWGHRAWKAPGLFMKPPSALIGHGDAIVIREDYGLTHPEPELAAVIGKRARNISEDQVLDHIFGFTIINDITSPKLKEEDSIEINMPGLKGPEITWRKLRDENDSTIYLTYHARSKGCDTFAPMGPYVTTTDMIGDPNNLAIKGWLGDDLVTNDSTSNLSFNVQQVVAQASRFMTLEPGDIIHFGMAAVPAMPEKYATTWDLDMSRLGGPVAVEIEGIGILRNPVDLQTL
jgi:2-keto-4-pentenoate hydratase/2-oxohepta-3-ene-1,7-dioic acid hydratase in catechol pathway